IMFFSHIKPKGTFMSETIAPERNQWQEAEARVVDIIARKYPSATDPEQMAKDAREKLKQFGEAEALKFTETVVKDDDGAEHSYKSVGLPHSETPGEELPVADVIDYLGLGDSHEFEFGVPDPDTNPTYLPTLS